MQIQSVPPSPLTRGVVVLSGRAGKRCFWSVLLLQRTKAKQERDLFLLYGHSFQQIKEGCPLAGLRLRETRGVMTIENHTRSPTDPWVAQHLREATPYGQVPKYLMCDHDRKFGSCFARVATTSAIEILKTPVYAPRANAICERFLRSVRQECLDHLLILYEKQLQRVLDQYVAYFNLARPHQGIQQQIPELRGSSGSSEHTGGKVMAVPILAGLHHDYQRVA
jgi:hypothetical protein